MWPWLNLYSRWGFFYLCPSRILRENTHINQIIGGNNAHNNQIMWIHTTIKYRGRSHISIHTMDVPRPYLYLCHMAVFLFVPRPYLDWKHTHNNKKIGEMAHAQ